MSLVNISRKKSRVIVLGADRMPGRRIAAALSQTDWALPIAAGVHFAESEPGIEQRVTDGIDPRSLDNALREVDCIVNAVSGSPKTVLMNGHALFVSSLAARRELPIVHLSSMTVYGAATGVVSEDAAPVGELGSYADAKRQVETWADRYGFATTLRLGCEYGPDCWQWSERVARWLTAHRMGDLGAAGDGYCNLVYVDDIARAVSQALTRPHLRGRKFNLSLPSPPTWNDYFGSFARALGAVPLRRITRRRLKVESKLLAPPLKVAEMLANALGAGSLHLPPPIPASVLSVCKQEIILNVAQAQTALEIEWTPLESGLRATAEWCRSR
jgi:nucleoside-diphosphate-sugar epimerase